MAVPLRSTIRLSGAFDVGMDGSDRSVRFFEFSGWKNGFREKQVLKKKQSSSEGWASKAHSSFTIHTSVCTPRALRWWEKSSTPNMTEINSADELVHSLLNAGDKLVVVDFYAPGCGGCRTLHPKICQIAESNPSTIFLRINYDEHKAICSSLHIHVLPFFRFYRGAEGRVCSFSCTNATIKKFKDALAKHGSERCSLGPAKGLEESELLSLALNKDVQMIHPLQSSWTQDFSLPGVMTESLSESIEMVERNSPVAI